MFFTKLRNKILEKIITTKFTQRQLKILLLIFRFSLGANKPDVVFDKKDFFNAGISPYDVEEILKKLLIRRVIQWDPERKKFWINRSLTEWIDKDNKFDNFQIKN